MYRSAKRQRLGDGSINLKPVSDWTVDDIIAEECPLQTHLTVLQAPRKNLTNILDLYHKATAQASSSEAKAKAEAGRDSKSKSSKVRRRIRHEHMERS